MKRKLTCLLIVTTLLLVSCGKKDSEVSIIQNQESNISVSAEESSVDDSSTESKTIVEASQATTLANVEVDEGKDTLLGKLECSTGGMWENKYIPNGINSSLQFTFKATQTCQAPLILDMNGYKSELTNIPLEAGEKYEFLIPYKTEDFKDIIAYVESDGIKSNTVVLRACESLTNESSARLQKDLQNLEEINNDLITDGYIDQQNVEEALKRVESAANEIKESSGILEIKRSDTHVYIRFKTGIEYIYAPPRKGIKASGDEISIYTLQPYADPSIIDHLPTEAMDNVAQYVDETFEEIEFSHNIDDSNVSLDYIIDSFSRNQIIIWDGHGDYDEEVGAYLITGQVWDGNAGSLPELGRGWFLTNGNRICVDSCFFDELLSDGSLNNTFVILNACCTAKYDEYNYLLQTLSNKGAEAVIGFTDYVDVEYANNLVKLMLEKMCLIDDSTGDYFTAYEAICYAAGAYGENDSVQYNGNGAAPFYYGNQDYRFLSALDNMNDSISISDGVYKTAFGPSETSDIFDYYGTQCGNLNSAYYDKKNKTLFVSSGFINSETGEVITTAEYELPCSENMKILAYGGEDDDEGNPVYYEEQVSTFNEFFTEENNERADNTDLSEFGFRMTIEDGNIVELFLFGS